MIDTNSGYNILLDQRKRDSVDAGKHFWILDSDGGQVINVEESPIIDLIRRNSPKAQAIGLLIEQSFELIKAMRVSLASIDVFQDIG